MAEKADPIGIWTEITDGNNPTPFFVQQWNSQLNVNAYAFNDIIAGEGLSGGGALADGEVTLSLPDVGTADTYGSATEVPVITTDDKGRVTDITLATVTATVEVEDDDVDFGNFTIFNFKGAEWTLTDAGGGQVDVEVSAGSTGVDVEDEGVSVVTGSTTLNFTGGVAVTDAGGGQTDIDIFAGPDVEDEGVSLGTADTFDFVGAGVTATFSAGKCTVTVSGGGGGSGIDVEDDGVSVETGATTMNFTGAGVVVTNPSAGEVEVAIAGGGGGGGGGSGGGSGTYGGVMIGDSSYTTFNDASATKGIPFMPTEDVTVHAVNALINPSATTETYTAQIVEFSAGDNTGSVDALVATSEEVTAVDTQFGVYRFTFADTVTLDRGTIYLVAINRTDGTGTSTLVLLGDGNVTQSGPFVCYSNGTQYFDTTALVVSDSNDGNTTTSEVAIWIECVEDFTAAASAATTYSQGYNIEDDTNVVDAGDGLTVEDDWTTGLATWSVQGFGSGTVDPFTSPGTAVYDTATRDGTLLFQMDGGETGSNANHGIRTTNLLADGESIVFKVISPTMYGGSGSALEFGIGQTDNSSVIRISASNNDGIQVETERMTATTNRQVVASGDTGNVYCPPGVPVYLRATRDGSTVYWMWSLDGKSWNVQGSSAQNGSWQYLWFYCRVDGASPDIQAIFGIEWIRHVASTALDLW